MENHGTTSEGVEAEGWVHDRSCVCCELHHHHWNGIGTGSFVVVDVVVVVGSGRGGGVRAGDGFGGGLPFRSLADLQFVSTTTVLESSLRERDAHCRCSDHLIGRWQKPTGEADWPPDPACLKAHLNAPAEIRLFFLAEVVEIQRSVLFALVASVADTQCWEVPVIFNATPTRKDTRSNRPLFREGLHRGSNCCFYYTSSLSLARDFFKPIAVK